jgi:hypothetical protein
VTTEAEFKENQNHGEWDPMPELTITSPYVHSTESTSTHLPWAAPLCQSDLNPMPESTLSPSQGLWIWPLVALIAIYRQL